MGLPMDDIHNPTVRSGPTSTPTTRDPPQEGERTLLDLIADKARLEDELKALSGVLDSVCTLFGRSRGHRLTTSLSCAAWCQHGHQLDHL